MSKPFKYTSNPEYSNYIALSRYARWNDELKRRESWEETVDRLHTFWNNHLFNLGITPDPNVEDSLCEAMTSVQDLEVMPSMRTLMTAGEALERDNVAGYNCAYTAIESPRDFDEILYILMCGTGVGFSVERQYTNRLPEVPEELYDSPTTIIVPDSKIGWASSFRELISLLYSGKIPKWDLSRLRPAGAPLKTFGGRSSGPEPLDSLFKFTVNLFKQARGRKLNSIECHDLVCKIADIVVVGGVRRSALISLSNPSDDRMQKAKHGAWWEYDKQRALANNSAAYTEKPDYDKFLNEWVSLYESRSGERGIFSRVASQKQAEKNGRRDSSYEFGTNPCSEIILRSKQFCNLSEVIIRPEDTFDSLKRKVRVATIIGTLQSTLTKFRYLRNKWKENTEEERLLGVSLTGIMDHPIMNGTTPYDEMWTNEMGGKMTLPMILEELRRVAIETNEEWASKLGINVSAAITCIKPSGTVSQLVDSASGIHPRYARHYLRTVRADKKDPLAQFMVDKGFYYEDDVMNPHNYIFYFPMKAPEDAPLAHEFKGMEQLNLWKIYQDYWCEHKPSMTCYYTDDDFMEIGNWIWNNFDEVSGVSFLPYDGHVYEQAPYIPVDEKTYEEWLKRMPKDVDWLEAKDYETRDNTTGSQEYACTGGACEIV